MLNKFQFEYLSPGFVRSGINDFCIIYTEREKKIHFNVESSRTSDGAGLKYTVKVHDFYKQSPEGRLIIKRLRDYIKNDELIQFLHGNISIGS